MYRTGTHRPKVISHRGHNVQRTYRTCSGRNIPVTMFGDTSVGDELTLLPFSCCIVGAPNSRLLAERGGEGKEEEGHIWGVSLIAGGLIT
jgi:hypothetical protein